MELEDIAWLRRDYSHAISSCRDEIRPQPYFFIDRAKALVSADDDLIEVAIEGLDEGLKTLGLIASIHAYAVELELKRKNYDGAIRRLKKMEAQYGKNPDLLMRIAEISLMGKRYHDARKACRDAANLIDNLPPYRQNQKGNVKLKNRIAECLTAIPSDKPNH